MSTQEEIMHESRVPLYAISVAADLAETTIANLRSYERHGLLEPDRTEGGTRRYSDHDVARLLHIRSLIDEGLNVAGIQRVLALEAELFGLRASLARVKPQKREPRKRPEKP
jgi:MerR family transcriptional regulator/heat shock protein HspR